MRDALFYFQLGFEHGYQGELAMSYPDDNYYANGYTKGGEFRSRVLKLAPMLAQGPGDQLTVTFPYALHGVEVPASKTVGILTWR